MSVEDPVLGWAIVCPDNRIRSHPFHSLREAEQEAQIINHTACRYSVDGLLRPDDPVEWADPLCPGGEHEVWPSMPEEDAHD